MSSNDKNEVINELGLRCLSFDVNLAYKHLSFIKFKPEFGLLEYRRKFIEIYGMSDLGKSEAISILKENNMHDEIIRFLSKTKFEDMYLFWTNALHSYIAIGNNEYARKSGEKIFHIILDRAKIATTLIEQSLKFSWEKVYLSYSLFGDKKNYRYGAIENCKRIKEINSDWIPIIYYSNEIDDITLKTLEQHGAELIFGGKRIGYEALMWRYKPFYDKDNSLIMVRDCDSKITQRECLLIDEWMRSDKPFHLMRDHLHHAELIMAGMFSGHSDYFPRKINLLSSDYIYDRWLDQENLRKLYKEINNKCFVHDTFYKIEPWALKPSLNSWSETEHIGARFYT